MNTKITNENLENKARKILTQEDVVKYLETHYNITFTESDKENDLFDVLYSLSSREINKLLNKDNTDKKLKMLYDIIYYRETKDRNNKSSYRALDKIKNL